MDGRNANFVVVVIGISAIAASTWLAVAMAAETELNGWRLQQFIRAADTDLGVPVETIDDPPIHQRVYMIDDDAYMVFSVDDRQPGYIQDLQLTGTTGKALAFKGLRLGDSEATVTEVLGSPTNKLEVPSSKVIRYEYAGQNYTIEIDDQARLFSIKLFTDETIFANPPDGQDPWEAFKRAVLARDFAAVSGSLRPDVEIYRSGEVLSIGHRFSDFVARPDPGFAAVLFSGGDSVRANLLAGEPEQFVRVHEHVGVGLAYKFPPDSALQEIVFLPYDGRYRVYEIRFRDTGSGRPKAPETTLGAR